MNQQPTNQGGERNAQPMGQRGSSVHPARHRRMKKNEKKLRLLQLIMTAVIISILIVGMLLLILPQFRVKTIEVKGEGLTSAEIKDIETFIKEEINGKEIWEVKASHKSRELDRKIYDKFPYLATISISCRFSKVTITVTKLENLMYTEHGGEWYAFDADLHVWMKNAEGSAFSPFLKVKLPALSAVSVGQKLGFSNTHISYGYIAELVEGLRNAEVLEHVTYIDFSDKFGISCVIEDTFRMELGDMSMLDRKLTCFYQVLKEKNSNAFAVIDVSDPTKATYRTVAQNELYQ